MFQHVKWSEETAATASVVMETETVAEATEPTRAAAIKASSIRHRGLVAPSITIVAPLLLAAKPPRRRSTQQTRSTVLPDQFSHGKGGG